MSLLYGRQRSTIVLILVFPFYFLGLCSLQYQSSYFFIVLPFFLFLIFQSYIPIFAVLLFSFFNPSFVCFSEFLFSFSTMLPSPFQRCLLPFFFFEVFFSFCMQSLSLFLSFPYSIFKNVLQLLNCDRNIAFIYFQSKNLMYISDEKKPLTDVLKPLSNLQENARDGVTFSIALQTRGLHLIKKTTLELLFSIFLKFCKLLKKIFSRECLQVNVSTNVNIELQALDSEWLM